MNADERAAAVERARLAIHHWRRQDIPVDPTPIARDVIQLAEQIDALEREPAPVPDWIGEAILLAAALRDHPDSRIRDLCAYLSRAIDRIEVDAGA